MTPSSSSFPWFFFWKVARLLAVILAGTLALMGFWDGDLAMRCLPFFAGSYLTFMFAFGILSRPLRLVLERVARIIQADLPYGQQLSLFYQKNEWAQIDAALVDATKKQQGHLQTIREENSKFTSLLESISNEILAVDRQSNVLFYNPRFARTFLHGKEKLQQGGKLWSVLEHPEAVKAFEDALQGPRLLKLKGFPVMFGSEARFYNLSLSPLASVDEKGTGVVGVFTDVTDAKLAEQMRVDFVANVSHEIRTPLTSVKGFSQMLAKNQERLPEDLRGILDKILHNSERMIALFNDLLNLSAIEAKDRVQVTRVDVDELMDHVESTVASVHKDKALELTREFQEKEIEVDPKLFEQVLINLVENACKYGGAKPQVKVQVARAKHQVEVRVSDQGPGIPKEHLGRIFERFYRVDSSRERGTGGTGLGLAIVKHIVAKHQGTIRAESDGVRGTTFIIELPRA